jgi:hypothetical protein
LKIRLLIIVSILLLSIFFTPQHAKAETDTLTLLPTDDAYVNAYWRGNHNGPTLEVEDNKYGDNWLISRIYLKFDVSNLDYNRIAKATLYLKCYSGFPPDPLPVSACKTTDYYKDTNAPWKESSLTWDNAPDVGDEIVITWVDKTGGEKWHSWDSDAMTTYVKTECANDGIVSVIIKFTIEKCPIYCSRNRLFYSKDWYYNHPYLEISLKPSIESCDAQGNRKDIFYWRDTIYANGSGYSPSTSYNLYILNDVNTWIDGIDIPAHVIKTQVYSDAYGKIVPTAVWSDPHTVGQYDILVDVNNNGKYDAIIDALDDNDIQITSGFITVKPQYQLTITITGSGTTAPPQGNYLYDDESVVSVSAAPTPGWRLQYWLLDSINVGSLNPYVVTMNNNHVLEAVFIPIPQYTLDINVTGSGTTNPMPGSHLYLEGTLALVNAIPNPGWTLDYWLLDSNNVGSSNPYQVTMNSDHTLTAVFVKLPPSQYELTIQVSGSGTTDPTPNSYLYDKGSVVSVHAFPNSWWILDHWLLDSENIGNGNPCEVTMNDNHTLVAVFIEKPPATIESCDSTGKQKDTFKLNEIVYANGDGYLASTTYDLYIVNDVETWTNGMPIPTPVVTIKVTSDSSGKILPIIVWNPKLTLGKYDIVVDVDGDGKYTADRDALDSNDIEVTAGFFVIPEYPFGVIVGLAGLFAALLVFCASKKRKPSEP